MSSLYHYRASVFRVVDGDTVDLVVDVGFGWKFRDRFRLADMDAPERFTEDGIEATQYLRELLPFGSEVRIDTRRNPRDKFGRWLVSITLADGRDVAASMIEAGHAIAYAGRGE